MLHPHILLFFTSIILLQRYYKTINECHISNGLLPKILKLQGSFFQFDRFGGRAVKSTITVNDLFVFPCRLGSNSSSSMATLSSGSIM